jgi:hypothetical protein
MRTLMAMLLTLLLAAVAMAADSPLTPILIPINYNGPGAFGSAWWTRIVLNNHTTAPFATPGVLFRIVSCPIPEGCLSESVPASDYGQIESPEAAGGLLLYASSDTARDLAFQARFGLGSSDDVSTSCELPVVREAQFLRGPVRLPSLALYGSKPVRSTLRIYGVDAIVGTRVRVEVRRWDLLSGDPLASKDVTLNVPASPPGTVRPVYPAVAQLTLQQEFPFDLLQGNAFNVTVVPMPLLSGEVPRIWAFISTTENATNDVLIQQPQ